jgi:hypothetical protein
MILGLHVNQGWAQMDGNGHYWPAQPPGLPPSFYPTPADPLVSPTYEGWWRRSFSLAARIWKPALTLQAILFVPLLALVVPAGVVMAEEQEKFQKAAAEQPGEVGPLFDFMTAVLGVSGLSFVAALVTVLTTAITVQLVVLTATGRAAGLRAAAGLALRRAHALIGWQIAGALLTGLGLLACGLPGVYVMAAILVLPVVVTLERGAGIGRCFALFHASFGTAVSRIATIVGLQIALSVVLGIIGIAVQIAVGGSAGIVASTVVSALHYLPAGVFVPPLLVTAYADMRARREPFSTAYLAPAPTPQAA